MLHYTKKTSTTNSAADRCTGDPISSIHPDIIKTHILNRLDGATLASTSSASSYLLSLCSDDQLWRDICNSTWPSTTHPRVLHAISSFPSAHRSFYSDAFPSATHNQLPNKTRLSRTLELISAVDIYYEDQLIYSKVLETRTFSDWFLSIPLSLNLLGPKELVPTPLKFDCSYMSLAEENLKVSWILIDPNNKRAVNVASHKAVESRRSQWSNGDIQLRYATVAATGVTGEMVQVAVVVTCGGTEGGELLHMKEVRMKVEDMEGKSHSGRESLRIIQAAMEGRRRRIDCQMEKDVYEMLLRKKAQIRLIREKQQRRETCLDMIHIIIVGLFVGIFGSIFCWWRHK